MNIQQIREPSVPDPQGSYLFPEKVCIAGYLGVMPYEPALKLQQRLVQARSDDMIPNLLLLLQHPPLFTIGRFRGEDDFVVPAEVLTRQGVAVFHTNRGGGVTYHGPGQLVGYPILDLRENCLGVGEYIWKLEEVIIKLLLAFGIQGHRVAKYPGGIWVGEEKICSIGIHISHHITMHGFALNVNTDLRYFEYINPCGIGDKAMTSLAKLTGDPLEAEEVVEALLNSFAAIFGFKIKRGLNECLAIPDAQCG